MFVRREGDFRGIDLRNIGQNHPTLQEILRITNDFPENPSNPEESINHAMAFIRQNINFPQSFLEQVNTTLRRRSQRLINNQIKTLIISYFINFIINTYLVSNEARCKLYCLPFGGSDSCKNTCLTLTPMFFSKKAWLLASLLFIITYGYIGSL